MKIDHIACFNPLRWCIIGFRHLDGTGSKWSAVISLLRKNNGWNRWRWLADGLGGNHQEYLRFGFWIVNRIGNGESDISIPSAKYRNQHHVEIRIDQVVICEVKNIGNCFSGTGSDARRCEVLALDGIATRRCLDVYRVCDVCGAGGFADKREGGRRDIR